MGVPGFFSWIMKRYKKQKFLSNSLQSRPKGFYVDANCLFHPQCFKILGYVTEKIEIDKLESMMIQRIIVFLTYLECYVNPSDFMFISVDGVAPLAKIGQQRKRRYRSCDDLKMKEDINKKYGKTTFNTWNNTVISPGTKFMETLHQELLKFYENRKKKNFKYIYSSYHVPGEGEHKILQHIKLNNAQLTDVKTVIYGLDADLIFLALASKVDNIYLLRESVHFGNKIHDNDTNKDTLFDPIKDVAEDMTFVSINIVRQAYNTEMHEIIQQMTKLQVNKNVDFMNDFIFLCFILGNDFLPHLPSLDIKKEGLDYIIEAYVQVYYELKQLIITFSNSNNNSVIINELFVNRLLIELAKKENHYCKHVLPEYQRMKYNRKCFLKDDCQKELWNIENMTNMNIYDPIKLGYGEPEEWKYRYYEHYYGVSENKKEFVDMMIKYYLEGLVWVSKYYFEKCIDWQWQYPYNHGPFISDISNYMDSNNDIFKNINFTVKKNIPIMAQLLSILPPKCANLLPIKYGKLIESKISDISDMFPISISLDLINKDQYWQCIPLIPTLNINRILNCISNIVLLEDECIRNEELCDICL